MQSVKSIGLRSVCKLFSSPSPTTWCQLRHELRICSQRRLASDAGHGFETGARRQLVDTPQMHPCFRDHTLLSSPSLLLQHLKANIVHEDETVIAINKPSGTPSYQRPTNVGHKSGRRESKIEGGQEADRNVSIQELLPDLRGEFGCPELCIALPAQRDHSGVVVLGKTKESREKLKRCQQHARAQKLPIFTFLIISSAVHPPPPRSSSTVIFTLKQIGDLLLPVVADRKSRAAQEKGEQLVVQLERSSLAWNPRSRALLSRVSSSQDQDGWGCLEAHMARLLCPVLGDAVYSRGVRTVLGLPLLVDPALNPEPQQVLSEELLEALRMRRSQLPRLPLFLHRQRVSLTLPKQLPLVITAPPPHSFAVALQRLGLETSADGNVGKLC